MPHVKVVLSSPQNVKIVVNVLAALSNRPADSVRDHVLDCILSYVFLLQEHLLIVACRILEQLLTYNNELASDIYKTG